MDKNIFMEWGKGVLGGMVGALVFLVIMVAIIVRIKPFDYRAVVIVHEEQLINDSGTVLSLPESELFQSMRTKGVLLTPAEYTDNLVGYYNSLIAFLAIFFIIFTVLGYFVIRSQSKKEVRNEAREILLDSAAFRKDVIGAIKGEFDQLYLSHEDYDEQLRIMQEDIESLKNNDEEDDGKLKTKETVIEANKAR